MTKPNLVVSLLRDGYKIINQQIDGHSLYYVNDVLMDYERNRDFFEAHKEADIQGLIVTRFTDQSHVYAVVLKENPSEWIVETFNTPDWDWLLPDGSVSPAIRDGEVTTIYGMPVVEEGFLEGHPNKVIKVGKFADLGRGWLWDKDWDGKDD